MHCVLEKAVVAAGLSCMQITDRDKGQMHFAQSSPKQCH